MGRKAQFIEFQVDEDMSVLDINRNAHNQGLILTHLVARKRKLEEEFLQITGNRK